MGRYDESTILKDENGTRYLNRIQYPTIPLRDSDILVKGLFGQIIENLANKFYGNVELWWIIARANEMKNDHMYLVPGKEYRITQNVSFQLRKIKECKK